MLDVEVSCQLLLKRTAFRAVTGQEGGLQGAGHGVEIVLIAIWDRQREYLPPDWHTPINGQCHRHRHLVTKDRPASRRAAAPETSRPRSSFPRRPDEDQWPQCRRPP